MRHLALAAAALLALVCCPIPAANAASDPIHFDASLPAGARLGEASPLRVAMTVDVERLRSPIADVQVLMPEGLDVASSGLGMETCRRPPAELELVRVPNREPAHCPRNALLGTGTAGAALVFGSDRANGEVVPGFGDFRLYSGESQGPNPGVNVLAGTVNPVFMQLSFGGELFTARRPFGLALKLDIRQIPTRLFGAVLALNRMRVTLGGPDIVYRREQRGRASFYRPGGVVLPQRCSGSTLPFRLILRFADDTQRTVDTTVPCPRRRSRR